MKILLFFPEQNYYFHSIGLAYLHAYLEDTHKLQVTFADLDTAVDFNEYDLIGMSIHTLSVPTAIWKLGQIRAVNPKVKCICGGPHPTALPQQMLDIGFDQVVVGVGHGGLDAILGGDTSPIIYGSPDYIKQHQRPRFYLQSYTRKASFATVTSLGCPFSCSFCSSAAFWKHRWMPREIDTVIEEILWALEKQPLINRIYFYDDNFTLRRDHVYNFCKNFYDRILPKYPHLQWFAFSRAETIDPELCALLKLAHCTQVYLGLESCSPQILSKIGKKNNPENQSNAVRMLTSAGIMPYLFFIVGLPGETQESIDMTAEFLRTHQIPWSQAMMSPPVIYPNTELFEIAKGHGFDPATYLKELPYFTYEHPRSQLDAWYKQLEDVMRPNSSKLMKLQ